MDEQRGMTEPRGCGFFIWTFVIILILMGYLVWQKGDFQIVRKPKGDGEKVKVVTESEWHDLGMEIAYLQTEIADIKSEGSKKVSLYRFAQDSNTGKATLTLRNNTKRTITFVHGRLFYCSMSGKIIAYKDFSRNMKIEPGMATNVECNGAQLPEGMYYHTHAPKDTPREKLYEVHLRAMHVQQAR